MPLSISVNLTVVLFPPEIAPTFTPLRIDVWTDAWGGPPMRESFHCLCHHSLSAPPSALLYTCIEQRYAVPYVDGASYPEWVTILAAA